MSPKCFTRVAPMSARLVGCLMMLALPFGGCAKGQDKANISYTSDKDAASSFEAGANRRPTARTLYAMTRILAGQGRDAECEFVLRRIMQHHPHFMPAYVRLAALQLRHGRIDAAMTSLTTGLRVSPRDPVLLNDLGMCWLQKSNYDKALDVFTRAAGVAPQEPRYRANMAVALGMMGRYDESLSLFSLVLPAVDAHHNLGVLCQARNDVDRAEAPVLSLTDSPTGQAPDRPPVDSHAGTE